MADLVELKSAQGSTKREINERLARSEAQPSEVRGLLAEDKNTPQACFYNPTPSGKSSLSPENDEPHASDLVPTYVFRTD